MLKRGKSRYLLVTDGENLPRPSSVSPPSSSFIMDCFALAMVMDKGAEAMNHGLKNKMKAMMLTFLQVLNCMRGEENRLYNGLPSLDCLDERANTALTALNNNEA